MTGTRLYIYIYTSRGWAKCIEQAEEGYLTQLEVQAALDSLLSKYPGEEYTVFPVAKTL